MFGTIKKGLAYYNAGVAVANAAVIGLAPGASPKILSYNATGSLVRFENIFLIFIKRSILIQRRRCSCKCSGYSIGSWSQSYDPITTPAL
jgi:hypothetical protein